MSHGFKNDTLLLAMYKIKLVRLSFTIPKTHEKALAKEYVCLFSFVT